MPERHARGTTQLPLDRRPLPVAFVPPGYQAPALWLAWQRDPQRGPELLACASDGAWQVLSPQQPSVIGEAPNPPLDLDEFVKAKGAMDPAKTVALGIKLCSAVKYAHKRGVIHRDIKPANILFNDDWEPKLADFGLARQVNTQQEGATLAGAQLLTLGYGAPEQEVDASKVDERADIYGMGGTLWFAISGQNPRFFRESEVPEVLRTVLAKALHKDREKRYQTAAEFEEALAGLDLRLKQGPAAEAADQNKKAAEGDLQAFADRVATLRSESRYQEAINSLRAMTLSVDPNQRGLSQWAD